MNDMSACWQREPSLPVAGRAADHPDAATLRRSGLFDADFYAANTPGMAEADEAPLHHYLRCGWQAQRQPNRYFDPVFYVGNIPPARRPAGNPLLHYLHQGEAAGHAPSPLFDLLWYRAHHDIDSHQTALRHFLDRRITGSVSPLPEFDPAFYLAEYLDVREAGVDPAEHYLLYGYKEGRNPSACFDTRFYLHRYLDGEMGQNPLLHYRRFRHALRLHTQPPPNETSAFQAVAGFTRPGPAFETREALPASARRQAKVLAYYLPQFHAMPENDAWWGTGFTEWTSLARALPRFAGHYQPRIPRDLGHYTLGPEIMRRQIDMAREAGLFGFVQYFYWFNGRRLLERPLEQFLADDSLDFPFCLMWANENWTRRWDGSDHEVLISQDYRAEDDTALIDCLARHFRDPRYIRLDGRPVLMVYRARLIPDTAATLARWRALFHARHAENPVLVMAQAFNETDPRPYGFDGAIEFPPHKLVAGLAQRNPHLAYLDPEASAQVFAYDDVAAASLAEPAPDFPLIKTAVPGWDNDARRQGAGLVLHGATPAAYQDWLAALVQRSAAHDFLGERLVCVNAWNEWAEGAYLEPDVHFGSAFLNATGRAIAGIGRPAAATSVLLVGHDAFPAGAQMLLLQLGRTLRHDFGVQVEFLLLGDGALAADYASVAPCHVVAAPERLAAHLAAYVARGFTAAIVNTAAAAWAAPALHAAGLSVTLAIHEMPRLIAEKRLLDGARAGAAIARHVVFACETVRDAFTGLVPAAAAESQILPQGCYRPPDQTRAARTAMRRRLGAANGCIVVLGAGYGDLRKGFDLFLQAWRSSERGGHNAVFCWAGRLDPGMAAYLAPEIAAATATGRFHALGHISDMAACYSAADIFARTSREDPYPTVLLEAACAGLPFVAFAGSGGAADIAARLGRGNLVAMADTEAMAAALVRHAAPAPGRRRCATKARAATDFSTYAARMLRLALPDLPAISVAVISYNYARFLPTRLASVFAQTHPVAEVVLHDDASADDSVAVAGRIAADWGRALRVVRQPRNSGSVFAQWRRAAEAATGDWLWIAEADDEAAPNLLERLASLIATAPDLQMAFCDSRAIDAEGRAIWPSYGDYYRQSGTDAFARSFVASADHFATRFLAERNLILNASAVLWRRSALLAALDRCGADLATWRVAGDWRVYVELLAGNPGSIAYLAEPLNVHRRHAASASAAQDRQHHLAEIARMHGLVADRLDLAPHIIAAQAGYRRQVADQFQVTLPG